MERYGSIKKSVDDSLIRFYDVELQMMALEYVDTLTPAVASMEAEQIVLQMMIELAEFIKKNGKLDRAGKSAKRLARLFELITKLNTLTGDNNTLWLGNKELCRQIYWLKKENSELKVTIEKMKNAEEF